MFISFTVSLFINIVDASPSLIELAFPAVTVPSFLNAALKVDRVQFFVESYALYLNDYMPILVFA